MFPVVSLTILLQVRFIGDGCGSKGETQYILGIGCELGHGLGVFITNRKNKLDCDGMQ